MVLIIGILLSIIFLLISLIHIYWALGGSFGKDKVLPEFESKKVLNPSKLLTLGVAFVFLLGIINILGIIGFMKLIGPIIFYKIGSFIISMLFLLRSIGDFKYVGIFKKIIGTQFSYYDSIIYIPLCLFISISSFYIFISSLHK